MSAIFSDPLPFGGLVNINIKANANTPLDLSQAQPVPTVLPPSGPPSTPLGVDLYETYISVSSSMEGITGSDFEYGFKYGFIPSALVNYVAGGPPYQGVFESGVADLTPDTVYYFQAVLFNSAGSTHSNAIAFRTPPLAPPSGTVGDPVEVGVTSSTFDVTVDITNVTGATVYAINWGLAGTLTNYTVASSVSATSYTCSVTDLDPSTEYEVEAEVSNAVGFLLSAGTITIETAPQ